MGYDNDCIVNMQSLPGEHFCPVCRTLIKPIEALQAPCTHLFCKPCLAYVVATTHACAYDGYLVTEADSKSLEESNKELAETIGKVAVYCLYRRSNCQWQGTLAESTAHCAGCTFGNSPVVCNRCGTQIMHRQVQEHAQICPGVQSQAQAAENAQAQAVAVANQPTSQDQSIVASAGSAAAATAVAAAPSVAATTVAPSVVPATATAVSGQAQVQGAAADYSQAAQAPTPEQWYQQQQQYQQYYQQYPGYDPYQQQYYAQYQQQAYPQYMQAQMKHIAPQPYMQQPQPLVQPGQPHVQGQPQAQPLPQPQLQPQPQGSVTQPQLQQLPQAQPQGSAAQPQLQQLPQPQPRLQPQSQPQPHVTAQVTQMPGQQPLAAQQPHPYTLHSHPPPQVNAAGQPYPQPQLHAAQARPPQQQAPLWYQQPIPPQHIPQQMPRPHAYPQPQPHAQHAPQSHSMPHPQQPPMQMQPQPQPQPHPHPHPHPHPQAIPQMQHPQPPAHAAAGYQSHPQPTPGAPEQHPMHMNPPQQGVPPQHPQSQSHFLPHQPSMVHPPHSQMTMPVQQQLAMPPPQGPPANLYPTQQQVQHPVHQPGPPVYQQPGMQPHVQHGFAQAQAQGTLHPGLTSQQGPAPLQHSLRPQGPAYVQQPTPGHPHAQMNAPPPQGMLTLQARARPMMVSEGMPQQAVPPSPVAGSKPMQSAPVQQSQLMHAGSQGASSATPKQGASTPEVGLAVKNAKGSKAGEIISEHVFDFKLKGDERKVALDTKEKDVLVEGKKDVSDTPAKEENVDGPLVRQVKAEEANTSHEVTEGSHDLKVAGGENKVKGQEGEFDDKSSSMFKGGHARPIPELHSQQCSEKSVQQEPLQPNLGRTNQGYVSEGQISEKVNTSRHSQQMQTQGASNRGQFQQQFANQSAFPTQGHGYPQPGYSDRNPSEFPQQYPGSDDRPGMPPGGLQQIPYGHPQHMPDPTMTSQRPPVSDRMLPQTMHQSSQERRFQEPSSNQMHVHGQAMPPSQMRPPGLKVHESFPHQGQLPAAQEPFYPPPHSGIPGPGLSPPPGSHHGFPPKGFQQQVMAPPGQTQSHPHLPHAGGARTALEEPLAWRNVHGPSPGALDTSNRMTGGPSFIPEDRLGKSAIVNAMEAEANAIKRHGVFDGRQLEPHCPLPTEHAPYGQPNVKNMSGMANHVPVGGMHESGFSHGLPGDRFGPLPEERFKPFPEERFRPAHDEHFRASALDSGGHIFKKRGFEEDLKQFPRPPHLDGEGPSRFDGYLSSSRSLEQHPGGANASTSRPLSSASLPPNFGGLQVQPDKGDRSRPLPLHDHPGRRHDGTFAHIDRLNLVHDFGRHRADGLPPARSPGHFSKDIADNLPNQPRRRLDGLGPLTQSLSSNIQDSEIVVPQSMPGFSRHGSFGGFHSHLDSSETSGPGNLPSHLRIGDPGFNGSFSSASREGDIDSFEQSRKRKGGSMARCLICKIDCDTIEGLDLHSQTREHQKMAMDMVLNIKIENAKKHRTSENAMPFEDANKLRKASFGKHTKANRKEKEWAHRQQTHG